MNTQSIKAVAYARCSTILHGQDPENQLVPIREVAQSRKLQVIHEYVDFVSGSESKRPSLDKLIRDARLGKFSVIVIYALDRLARDVRFLLNLLHELDGYGVSVISLREAIDFSSPVGKACISIIGVIAQLEKDLISERIRTALAVKKLAAQKNGTQWRCGRPVVLNDKIIEQAVELRKQGLSLRAIGKRLGISKGSVQRALDGPKTAKNQIKKLE